MFCKKTYKKNSKKLKKKKNNTKYRRQIEDYEIYFISFDFRFPIGRVNWDSIAKDAKQHGVNWNNCDGLIVTMQYDNSWPIKLRYPIVNLIRETVPIQCKTMLNNESEFEKKIKDECGKRSDRISLHAFTIDALGTKIFDDAVSWEDIDKGLGFCLYVCVCVCFVRLSLIIQA